MLNVQTNKLYSWECSSQSLLHSVTSSISAFFVIIFTQDSAMFFLFCCFFTCWLIWYFGLFLSNKIHLFALGFVHIDFKLIGFTTNQNIIESLMLSCISIWKTWWHLTPPYVSRYIFHWMGERVQAYFCILCDRESLSAAYYHLTLLTSSYIKDFSYFSYFCPILITSYLHKH